jgi:hypothetical protein
MAQGNNANVVVTRGEVAGAQAVILEDVTISQSPVITTDLVIASHATLLVMADRATAEAILSGQAGSSNPALTEAAQYYLPNTALAFFIDGAGYGDLIALGAGTTMIVSPSSESQDEMTEVTDMLQFGYDLFSSSSLTLALTDSGDVAVRGVITLK